MKYITYKSQTPRNLLYLLFSGVVVMLCILAPIAGVLRILLSVSAGVVIVASIWSLFARQSISSIILFYAFKMIPIKDRRNPEVFKNYMEATSKPYNLKSGIIKKYHIKTLDSYTDTYVIDHSRKADDLVIYFIHGGGYWVQLYGIHFTFFDKIAKRLNAKIVIPIYPLAPAHNAVEANEMVFSRYLHMLNENHVSPDRIIFMGDSAGAGLAISLMQLLRDRKQPLPREAVLFSPWVDVTNTTAGMLDVKDPFLNIPNLTYGGEVYAGELGTRHPMVSPIYGDMRGLPKITAFGGTYDSLNLDAEKMADKAAADGFDYTIYIYPKMIHGYVGFFFTPEAKYGFEMVCNIIEGKKVTNALPKP